MIVRTVFANLLCAMLLQQTEQISNGSSCERAMWGKAGGLKRLSPAECTTGTNEGLENLLLYMDCCFLNRKKELLQVRCLRGCWEKLK